MDPNFTRSQALNNIPLKKLEAALDSVSSLNLDKQKEMAYKIAINRYAESNIPIQFWTLKMDKDFVGDPRLKQRYDEYIADIKRSYVNGTSICFAGNHGVGKSLTCSCILKRVVQKGYSALYTTVSDVVSILTQAGGEEKFLARRELLSVDFLTLDELDPRFFSTDSAADLYARSLENIFRTRSQNNLPTLICTNSPNVVESFTGALKASLDSLMAGNMEMFVVGGADFRKKKPTTIEAAGKGGEK